MSALTPDTLLKIIAEPTRLRIVLLLQQHPELCVCHLQQALRLPQPNVSRHLKPLRTQEIRIDRRAGQWIYYQLNPQLPDWAQTILQGLAEGAAAHQLLDELAPMDLQPLCG